MARKPVPVRTPLRPGLSLIEEEYWYTGPISERKAEQVLCKLQESGSFLVRDSLLPDADFVLSVSSGKEIWHYEVQVQPTNECVFNNYTFVNLPAAIEFYTENRLGSVFLQPPTKPVVDDRDLPKGIGPQISVAHSPAPPPRTTPMSQHSSAPPPMTTPISQNSPAPPPRTTPITHRHNNTYDTIDIDMPDFPGDDDAAPKPMTKVSVGWPKQGKGGGGGGGRGPRDSGYSPSSGGNSSGSSSRSHSPREVKGHGSTSTGTSAPKHFIITSSPPEQLLSTEDHTYSVPPDAVSSSFLDHTYATPPSSHFQSSKVEEVVCETTFDEGTLSTTAIAAATSTPTVLGQNGAVNKPTASGKDGVAATPTTSGEDGVAATPTTSGEDGVAATPTTSGEDGAVNTPTAPGQSGPSYLQHVMTKQGDFYTVVIKENMANDDHKVEEKQEEVEEKQDEVEEEEEEDALPTTFKPRPKKKKAQKTPPLAHSTLAPGKGTPTTQLPPSTSSVHPSLTVSSSVLKAPENTKAEQIAELKRLPNIQRKKLELERRLKGEDVECPMSPQDFPTSTRRISIPEAVQNLPPGPPIGVSNPAPPSPQKAAPVKKRHSFSILRRNSKKDDRKEEVAVLPESIDEGSRRPTSAEQRRQSIRVATPISPCTTGNQPREFQSVFQSITKSQLSTVPVHHSPATAAPSKESAPVPMTPTTYSAPQHLSRPATFSMPQPASASQPLSVYPSSYAYSQPARYSASQPGNHSPASYSPSRPRGSLASRPVSHWTSHHSPSATSPSHHPTTFSSQPLPLSQVVPGLPLTPRQQRVAAESTSPHNLQRASTLPHLHSKSPSPQGKTIEPIVTAPMNTKRDKKRRSFRKRRTESSLK